MNSEAIERKHSIGGASKFLAILLVGTCLWIFVIPCEVALAAGVTIITHGATGVTGDAEEFPCWVDEMGTEVCTRLPSIGGASQCTIYTICVEGGLIGPLTARLCKAVGSDPSSTVQGEIVVLINWADVAGLLPLKDEGTGKEIIAKGIVRPTDSVAEAVVPLLLDPSFFPQLQGRAIVELPLHLIGHSRGAYVISHMARLLAERGIWLDQFTSLDGFPHPIDIQIPEVTVYENVLFADNYYQRLGGALEPQGDFVQGAYNRQLTYLQGGYEGSFPNHRDVHLWYHGTIDTSDDASDGEEDFSDIDRDLWYNLPGEDRGKKTGVYFSRIAASEWNGPNPRPKEGLHNRFLGDSDVFREPVSPNNDPQWPNIYLFDLENYSIDAGQGISFIYSYQDSDSDVQITLRAVSLPNPYNTSRSLREIGSVQMGESAIPLARPLFWQTTTGDIGTHYIEAEIIETNVASPRKRYYVLPRRVVVEGPTSTPTPTSQEPTATPTDMPLTPPTPTPTSKPSTETLTVELNDSGGGQVNGRLVVDGLPDEYAGGLAWLSIEPAELVNYSGGINGTGVAMGPGTVLEGTNLLVTDGIPGAPGLMMRFTRTADGASAALPATIIDFTIGIAAGASGTVTVRVVERSDLSVASDSLINFKQGRGLGGLPITSADFTLVPGTVDLGGGVTPPTPTSTPIVPDFDRDHDVDTTDLLELLIGLESGQSKYDLNRDGAGNYEDWFNFSQWWKIQIETPTPEP